MLALVPAVLLSRAAGAQTFEVTSALDEGAGSLRAAIEAANGVPGSRIRAARGDDLEIVVERALPPLTADRTILDGGGLTLREGVDCRRDAGQRGCDGVVVRAPGVIVKNVRVAGFTFDGIAVRGRRARGVRIESVEAIDNLDDGVGISEGASGVFVSGSLLMGNGFRTKGKGLLVFDEAEASLRDSVVVANRDGVTVSRSAHASLAGVLVAGNYDKGIGVSSASMDGRDLQVLANGLVEGTDAVGPNADGVRIGLDGRAELRDSLVAGNGDSGVVVLDRSSVTLSNCEVSNNRGRQTHADPQARLSRR